MWESSEMLGGGPHWWVMNFYELSIPFGVHPWCFSFILVRKVKSRGRGRVGLAQISSLMMILEMKVGSSVPSHRTQSAPRDTAASDRVPRAYGTSQQPDVCSVFFHKDHLADSITDFSQAREFVDCLAMVLMDEFRNVYHIFLAFFFFLLLICHRGRSSSWTHIRPTLKRST